ncbi:MAG TPA: peptidoglycan-associated lipoprotein Pal [Candidatus Acidoferrales bacterium]|nr:peptidoglycan-associated lipoprotein Pal [Candidatus Acidoferrales bacterium]
MQNRSFGRSAQLCLLAMAFIAGGCHHKTNTAPPPTPQPQPQPAARPTVTLQANPTTIEKGQSSTLTWSSTNATSLTLAPGVGSIAPEGSTQVSPAESTTYTITATGPGGDTEQTVRVTVGAAAPPPTEQPAAVSASELFNREMQDVYFDLDHSDIRADSKDTLAKAAQYLRTYPSVKVVIEGDCDERGSTEYNLGLGQRRADAVKQFLSGLGISGDRFQTVSYGKEKPVCNEHTEECWQRNRRAHFSPAQ